MGLRWDDRELRGNLQRMPKKVDRAIAGVMALNAPRAESAMRNGAPWTDRTGNARSGLTARAFVEPGKRYGIDLSHGVSYGIWLEVRFSGRYAIIGPTVQAFGPQVMTQVSTLLARL